MSGDTTVEGLTLAQIREEAEHPDGDAFAQYDSETVALIVLGLLDMLPSDGPKQMLTNRSGEWPDYADIGNPDWCEERHPDARPWESIKTVSGIDRNSELNCGRPKGHTGQHVVLLPDPCEECGAMAEHSPECETYDPVPEPDPSKWEVPEYRPWSNEQKLSTEWES